MLHLEEDPTVYTAEQIEDILSMINEGNKAHGGVKKLHKGYGIMGFIRFLQGYLMLVITKRKKVGMIAGHDIYAVGEVEYISVPLKEENMPADNLDQKYKEDRTDRQSELLMFTDMSNCFFSYSYDITNTYQYNCSHADESSMQYNSRFTWNSYLLSEYSTRLSPQWTLPIVHGYFNQACLNLMGREFLLSVIARRSRHYAGVRYLKRGINEEGNVANEVETEQILQDLSKGLIGRAEISSFVQLRGSIPLFWGQDLQSIAPKPPIVIVRSDPFYTATILHFRDLFSRYGSPLLILNLVKSVEKVPRETILKDEYERCIMLMNDLLPPEHRLIYIPWDFLRAQKNKQDDPVSLLSAIAEATVAKTGFFLAGRDVYKVSVGRKDFVVGEVQRGAARTNCVDSLDRTNAAQFCIGRSAFAHQLRAHAIDDPHQMENAISVLMELYEDMGNQIALQYGGSQLAHTMKAFDSKSWTSSLQHQSRELLTSVRRYYHNSFIDAEKQAAMNLFLGIYIPWREMESLWDLETDYLHHMRASPAIAAQIAHPHTILLASRWWESALAAFEANSRSRERRRPEWLFGLCYNLNSLTSFDKLLSHPFTVALSLQRSQSTDSAQLLPSPLSLSLSSIPSPMKAMASSASSQVSLPGQCQLTSSLTRSSSKLPLVSMAIGEVTASTSAGSADPMTTPRQESTEEKRAKQFYSVYLSPTTYFVRSTSKTLSRDKHFYASYLSTSVRISERNRKVYEAAYKECYPPQEAIVLISPVHK